MIAPPVERIERRYSLDEIRYSASVRQRMPSIDLDSINFETGSWEIPPDQAAKLQAIADGLNRAIARQSARGVPDRGSHRRGRIGRRQSVAVGSPRRIRSRVADPAIRCARGKPDLARLRRAISERADRRAEPDQSARHHPQHHAAARTAERPRCRRRLRAPRRRGEAKRLAKGNGREKSRPFLFVSIAAIRRRDSAVARYKPRPASRRRGSALVAIEFEDVRSLPRSTASPSSRRDPAWRGYRRCRGCAWSADRYGPLA